MNELSGKNIVVTGGAGALGSAVVDRLLAGGAACFVPVQEDSEPTRPSWSGDSRVTTTLSVELTSETAVATYFGSVPELWASVHIAGGFAMAPLLETSLADFRAQLELNLVTCFLSCREAAKQMLVTGDGGRIVNIASRPALVPTGGMSAYTTAKAGVASLTTSLAEELKGDGILVNGVVPSIIDTGSNRRAMPDADFDRWPKAAQIAEAIAFLVSPKNELTHGVLLPVYGQS